ncbi:splicing factor [Tieghemiomyces parasiticus]|uniref:Splicing factor n=1 Tax=Tieghemiomyces parasiticus TaxID=78921 RepID=A0A9W8A6J8_9FUNG|nr:splicing factor [Tieghemiomyces parasiticus]
MSDLNMAKGGIAVAGTASKGHEHSDSPYSSQSPSSHLRRESQPRSRSPAHHGVSRHQRFSPYEEDRSHHGRHRRGHYRSPSHGRSPDRKRQGERPDPIDCTVLVLQLGSRTRERDLYEFFEQVGPVQAVALVLDHLENKFRGAAFVEFTDPSHVAAAVRLSGTRLHGHPLLVDSVEYPKPRRSETNRRAEPSTRTRRRLFIGSIDYRIKEEDLRLLFEAFGPIQEFKVPLEESTGRSKGFAFLEYCDPLHAQMAIDAMHNFDLNGRPLRVEFMQSSSTSMRNATTDHGASVSTAPRYDGSPSSYLESKPRSRDPHLDHSGPNPVSTPAGPPLNFMHMTNMFNPATETGSDWDVELSDDVKEECRGFGTVRAVHVSPQSTAGNVFVEFEEPAACQQAVEAMQGRWFSGKQIAASAISIDQFRELRDQ